MYSSTQLALQGRHNRPRTKPVTLTHLPPPMLHYIYEQMNIPGTSPTTSSSFPPSTLRRRGDDGHTRVLENTQTLLQGSGTHIITYSDILPPYRPPNPAEEGRRGRRGTLGAGLKSKVPPFSKANSALPGAAGAAGAGFRKVPGLPNSGTILHTYVLSTLYAAILSDTHPTSIMLSAAQPPTVIPSAAGPVLSPVEGNLKSTTPALHPQHD